MIQEKGDNYRTDAFDKAKGCEHQQRVAFDRSTGGSSFMSRRKVETLIDLVLRK